MILIIYDGYFCLCTLFRRKEAQMKNILIHIPHSSYFIPQKYKKLFYLSKQNLFSEQLKMSDSYTDELFDIDSAKKLVFPISRLICDVERFRNEQDEEMTKQGMWVCYTKTSDLKPLKKLSEKHKQEILKNYYDKHHKIFEKMVEKNLNKYGSCIIIDAHSFSSAPLPYELHAQTSRPDICIGTDNFHTPEKISKYFYSSFKNLGYKTEVNNPFCGTIIPIKYYQKNKNVKSVMIEINRSLYMNEKTGEKSPNFNTVKNNLHKIISSFAKNFD